MTSRTGKTETGYVLVELLIVAAITTAVLALAIPLFGGAWREASFNASAREFASCLMNAQRTSVSEGKNTRIAIDLERNRYSLEIATENERFEPIRSSLDKPRTLPHGSSFLFVEEPGEKTENGEAYIPFFPDGTSRERKIVLKNKEGRTYEIVVHPATGAVATKQI